MKSKPDDPVDWVPIFGEFEFVPDGLRFKGRRITPPEPGGDLKDAPAFGLFLSNLTLADGDMSAEVEFAGVNSDSVCELAVAYDSNARQVATGGLGGSGVTLYAIREFGGPLNTQWWQHRAGGDRAMLKPNQIYRVEARLRGANFTLLIDTVTVASVDVTSPAGKARQVGLLCRGDFDITVRHFTVAATKPKAFVVMQFSGEYDDLYRDVVKEVCKDYEVNVLRADEVAGPGLILGDVVRELSTSQLVIADITPTNANVFFEVGYALALGKPTILLARKGTALPFDVAGFRVLFYEDTIGGKNRLEDGLRHHIDAILKG